MHAPKSRALSVRSPILQALMERWPCWGASSPRQTSFSHLAWGVLPCPAQAWQLLLAGVNRAPEDSCRECNPGLARLCPGGSTQNFVSQAGTGTARGSYGATQQEEGAGGAGISDPTGYTHSLAGLWPTDRPFPRPGAWAPDVRGPHPSLLTSPSTLLAALPLPTVQPNPTRCEPGCANVVGPLGCRQPGTAPHSIHTSLSIPLTSPLGTSRFFSPPC